MRSQRQKVLIRLTLRRFCRLRLMVTVHKIALSLSLFYDKAYTLFDYLPKEAPVFIDDFQKIVDRHGRLELEVANLLTEDLHQASL